MTDSLKSWVASPFHGPTRVFRPIHIDEHANEELRHYHPTGLRDKVCHFRLVPDPTDSFAVVEVHRPVEHWNSLFRAVVESLELRVVKEDGPPGSEPEFLLDENVRGGEAHPMGVSEWIVVRWEIRRTNRDENGEVTELEDRIVWKNKHGAKANSSYTWRPYTDDL